MNASCLLNCKMVLQQVARVLNQPVPPIVYGFKGFMATVENIEGLNIAAQQPPTSVDARSASRDG